VFQLFDNQIVKFDGIFFVTLLYVKQKKWLCRIIEIFLLNLSLLYKNLAE
jgi:hypothetical protein